MKLALIPPLSWLATSEVTNYQLMLPHLFEDHRYADHYRKLAKQSKQYVILDNGEAEKVRHRFEPAQLIGLGIYCEVDEIVVPDVIGNMGDTLQMMGNFFQETGLMAKREGLLRNDAFSGRDVAKLKFMGVVQGQNYQEALNCARVMMEVYGDKLHTIALPRHLLKTVGDNTIRLSLAEDIFTDYTGPQGGIRIHCLGASPEWPEEMLELGKQGIVDGMDTSMPYSWAYMGYYLNEGSYYVERPPRYFSRPARSFQQDALHYNIGLCKRWADGNNDVRRP